MKKVRNFVCLALILILIGCGGQGGNNDGTKSSLPSSGNKKMDQAARFARHIVEKLRSKNPDWPPSKIVKYMTSTQGSAALWPPNPEVEPELAKQYSGPRPPSSRDVAIDTDRSNPWAKYFLVLSGNDSEGTVVAEAYRKDENGPFFQWNW